MYDLVIKDGTIVTAISTHQADIGINGEKIAAIGQNLAGNKTLDATGKLVTPGAVDIHVHLQMPIGNFTSTDTFFSGSRAAAFGGTTTFIDFVETQPDQTMSEAIAARRALADPNVVVDYGLHMTIGPNDMTKLEQLPAAYAAGCTSFKLYMAYGLRLRDDELLRALTAVRNLNSIPVVHAENWEIISELVRQNLAAGRTSPHWHPRSRPALFEAEAAGRIIDIATFVGVPLHIFHVSCPETVAKIAAARQKGLPITGETCPQYLFLTQDTYDAPGIAGTLSVCSPPIRDSAAQAALWQALSRNDLQIVTTDHCPFTAEEKATGLHNYSQIPGGVPSIEMRFAALYSHGVCQGQISLQQWVAQCCTTPAKLMGLQNKGGITVGYDADLVIFDPEATQTITPETVHETAGWTPYNGLTLQGWPQTTLSRGKIVVHDGQFLGAMGNGRFIHRTQANL
ncbi:Dihydropyrimidinase [hydrothermal vent metagenome]|uniref:Dihydropyrimidinase n=1 Tax=hydrothermal vent metagenome TaxID=652676 RepID=A0A3B0VD27_9ZZZZ